MEFLSVINVAAMTYTHDQDAYQPVLDIGDDPMAAHPIFPEFAEFRAFEGFADHAGIFERGNALGQKLYDPARCWRSELREFLFGGCGKLNPPGHAS